MEHKYGKIPTSFKNKVTIPLVRTESTKKLNFLRSSQNKIFLRRAMYKQQSMGIGSANYSLIAGKSPNANVECATQNTAGHQ